MKRVLILIGIVLAFGFLAQVNYNSKQTERNLFAGSIAEAFHPCVFAPEVILAAPTTDTAAGDDLGGFSMPDYGESFDLVDLYAFVNTTGTTGTLDIQVHNVTQAADMLTTVMTIDSGELTSATAATPYVIDTANDDVAPNDHVRFDGDAVHTTAAKGLHVRAKFKRPGC